MITTLEWGERELEGLRYEGYAYLKEGRWGDAITLFKALVALAAESAEDWQALTALYLQKGEYALCLEASERALALSPQDEMTRLNRAKALLITGERAAGLALATDLLTAQSELILRSAEALLLGYSFS
ncbi:MAG: type III secretion chaperone [Parachlamydiales bacterium]